MLISRRRLNRWYKRNLPYSKNALGAKAAWFDPTTTNARSANGLSNPALSKQLADMTSEDRTGANASSDCMSENGVFFLRRSENDQVDAKSQMQEGKGRRSRLTTQTIAYFESNDFQANWI